MLLPEGTGNILSLDGLTIAAAVDHNAVALQDAAELRHARLIGLEKQNVPRTHDIPGNLTAHLGLGGDGTG